MLASPLWTWSITVSVLICIGKYVELFMKLLSERISETMTVSILINNKFGYS